MNNFFKPSLIIANSVPLTANQHDFYNYLLQQAYLQLEHNHFRDTFIFSYKEIKEFNSRLKSKKMIDEFFKEIYDKEFEFNILGKDNSIETNIKSRFITLIKKDKSNNIEIALEPLTIGALRKMVLKKKNIETIDDKNLNPYSQLTFTKDLSFYPSKVVYELVYDYKKFIKEIEFETFKKITDTEEKYQKNYNSMVINKIKKDLKDKIPGFNIKLIKEGRKNKFVKIDSFINQNFNNYYKNWLLKNKLENTITNKKICEIEFIQKGGIL